MLFFCSAQITKEKQKQRSDKQISDNFKSELCHLFLWLTKRLSGLRNLSCPLNHMIQLGENYNFIWKRFSNDIFLNSRRACFFKKDSYCDYLKVMMVWGQINKSSFDSRDWQLKSLDPHSFIVYFKRYEITTQTHCSF